MIRRWTVGISDGGVEAGEATNNEGLSCQTYLPKSVADDGDPYFGEWDRMLFRWKSCGGMPLSRLPHRLFRFRRGVFPDGSLLAEGRKRCWQP